ncbi:MAG TPA: ornithine cyclodeaminase family protein [Chthoniobacterales bacterium]|nr:ornithine cyclodeaminase family protein [Chthoniobacterales bacterium]
MDYFDEEKVRKLLRIEQLIPAMRKVLAEFSAGKWKQPLRGVLAQQGGFFGVMPASGESMGIKMVTFYPGNAGTNLPTHMAVIALFDPKTGEPLALMDGRYITEMRTAAVSAVATDALAAPDAKVLTLLGAGVQAQAHLEVLPHVRRFEEVRVWNHHREKAERFAEEHRIKAMGLEAAVRDADVIVTATSAREPFLKGEWLKPGAHVNAVGASRPDWRELDDAAMGNAVIVDSYEGARNESGDVILSKATPFAELGEILNGTKSVAPGRTTIFKSLGMAVEDVAAARMVYEAGRQNGDGLPSGR